MWWKKIVSHFWIQSTEKEESKITQRNTTCKGLESLENSTCRESRSLESLRETQLANSAWEHHLRVSSVCDTGQVLEETFKFSQLLWCMYLWPTECSLTLYLPLGLLHPLSPSPCPCGNEFGTPRWGSNFPSPRWGCMTSPRHRWGRWSREGAWGTLEEGMAFRITETRPVSLCCWSEAEPSTPTSLYGKI